MNEVYGSKLASGVDHEILADHGVFYPQALNNNLVFEVTLAPASQVVKGSDPAKVNIRSEMVPLKKDTDTRLNIRVNSQRRSMKDIPLLFVEPYTLGTRDSEKLNTSSQS